MHAYLDNSATTKPCPEAVQAVTDALTNGYYNPSAVYAPAVKCFTELRKARETILRQIGGRDCQVIFTSGGTEANNLAIMGTVSRMRGKQIIAVSAVEHPSVLTAFDALRALGHDVRVIGVDTTGRPDWDALSKALDDGASFVSMMQVNNETGALLDVPRLHALVAGRARIHIDGVQGFMRVPFDMRYTDLYTLSGHKIHAPKGVGALIVKKGALLNPRQLGGGQENGLRSGTENTPGIAGLRAAVEAMAAMEDVRGTLMQKKLRLVEGIRRGVPDVLINGPAPEYGAPHIVNLGFPDVRGEVMLHALESDHVYVSTGSACSSKKLKVSAVLTSMGIAPQKAEWAVRFSISPHTTNDEIDYAASRVVAQYDLLRRVVRR